MTQQDPSRLKPSLLAATLLTALVVGIAPTASAECGDLDDRCTYPDDSDGLMGPEGSLDCASLDPGDPGSGATGATVWYAQQNVFLACDFMDSVEDSILIHGGDMTWKLGLIAEGGAELFDTSDLVPTALVYVSQATDVVDSQVHDTCTTTLGPQNCDEDSGIPEDLQCPGGLEVPNPLGPGGLAGETLENSNGALQATCVLVGSSSATVPNATQVTTYVDDVQEIVLELNGDVFAFSTAVVDATCTYATGEPACV